MIPSGLIFSHSPADGAVLRTVHTGMIDTHGAGLVASDRVERSASDVHDVLPLSEEEFGTLIAFAYHPV
jgi:hypothetical protein